MCGLLFHQFLWITTVARLISKAVKISVYFLQTHTMRDNVVRTVISSRKTAVYSWYHDKNDQKTRSIISYIIKLFLQFMWSQFFITYIKAFIWRDKFLCYWVSVRHIDLLDKNVYLLYHKLYKKSIYIFMNIQWNIYNKLWAVGVPVFSGGNACFLFEKPHEVEVIKSALLGYYL